MLTAGVDLAAEPKKTAVAQLEWSAAGAWIVDVRVGADDEDVLALVHASVKTGIDAPFGWPVPFVAFLAAHEAGNFVAPEDIIGKDWRRTLAFRLTDAVVREVTGRPPLSVSADLISYPAMRCASLLGRLSGDGLPIDRCGSGAVVEVYPAASLTCWGLPSRGYKGLENRAAREVLVDRIGAEAPWLSWGTFEALCRASDDALDAVVAAMTARAVHVGLCAPPTDDQQFRGRTEGWIALPNGPLSALAPPVQDQPI